jgi:AcrR family transcriptional regulator
MSRRADPAIRAALTSKAVAYVLSHGVVDLSLRPLAEALGTSARMLVYHFGSRENLMRAIVEELRRQEDALIMSWLNEAPRTMPEFLDRYWKRMSDARARPAVRLIFELYALALRDPKSFPGMLDAPLDYWRKLSRATGSKRVDADATLLLAATRGLLLDLCVSGDRKRIDDAMNLLVKRLQPAVCARAQER